MANRKKPSNENVAKKIEAIKKAAANKRKQTVASRAESKKKTIANKRSRSKTEPEEEKKVAPKATTKTPTKAPTKRRTTKSKAAAKPDVPEIDYDSYPKTPVVLAWQRMVEDALNRYEATLPDKPSPDQKKRVEVFKERLRRAPYDLRNSGMVKKYKMTNPEKNRAKPKPAPKKRRTRKKK